MFNTLGCINSLQNHTSHIVDENEIFISLHIPWFSTNCNGLVNSKVLCATQITLTSESKIFSHGSTVSPKKTKFDYKIYYKETICGHFTLCIKDTIILWILFYWTYEEDMNLLKEMIIIRWIYAHIYLSQTRSSDWKNDYFSRHVVWLISPIYVPDTLLVEITSPWGLWSLVGHCHVSLCVVSYPHVVN